MSRKLTDGFTLLELLVVSALLLILAAVVLPRAGGALVELNLIAEARFAHAQAQSVRQHAIMRGRNIRVEYINSVPALIMVRDHQAGAALPEFPNRILPTGFALLPVTHSSKIVIFNSRGEATWIPSMTAPKRIVLRAPNGQERHLLFHNAGRIMLIKP